MGVLEACLAINLLKLQDNRHTILAKSLLPTPSLANLDFHRYLESSPSLRRVWEERGFISGTAAGNQANFQILFSVFHTFSIIILGRIQFLIKLVVLTDQILNSHELSLKFVMKR